MLKASCENRLLEQPFSTASLACSESLAVNSEGSSVLLTSNNVDSLKWQPLFVRLYLKIMAGIADEIPKEFSLIKSFDLLIVIVKYVNGLEIKQWDALIAEIEEDGSGLSNEEKNRLVDRKELKNFLANPKQIAKYLNLLLYKTDFIFRLISLVDAPLKGFFSFFNNKDKFFNIYPSNEETFYGKEVFFSSLTLSDTNILWPIFLALVKNFNNGINFGDIYFTEETNHQINSYIKKFLDSNYFFNEEVDSSIKHKTDFLLANHSNLRDLVITCLGSDKDKHNKIKEKLNIILAIKALYTEDNKESLAFVVYAALKALILTGKKDDLEMLFSAFIEGGIPAEILVGTKLHGHITQESARLDNKDSDDESLWDDNDLYRLAWNNIDPVSLLQQVELSSKQPVEILDWIWSHFFRPLGKKERFNLLKRGLWTSKALEQNNITLLDWYKTKFQELGHSCEQLYVDEGLDYKDVFIKNMHSSWMPIRDYGAGPYTALSHYEESKFAFDVQENNTAEDLFRWVKDSFKDKRSFEWVELLFDLSIRTKSKDIFDSAANNFLFFSDAEKVKKSYAVSRLIAVAVITNDSTILDLCWNKIINIEDKALQRALKKRILVDRPWAFHRAIRDGNIKIMDWILSRIVTLAEEETLSHLAYKCDLLYDLDSAGFVTSQQDSIVNAVLSGKVEVLNRIYTEMGGLISELDQKLDPASEVCRQMSTPSVQKWDPDLDLESRDEFYQNEDPGLGRASIIDQLKQDYFEGKSVTCLGYIPIFYNNKSYIYQVSEIKYLTQEEQEKFITTAFQSAIKYHNAEMLEVVWRQIEKLKPSNKEQALFLTTLKLEPSVFYFSKLLENLLELSHTAEHINISDQFKKLTTLAINVPNQSRSQSLQTNLFAVKTHWEMHEEKRKRVWEWLDQHPDSNECALASNVESDVELFSEPDTKKSRIKEASHAFLERPDGLLNLEKVGTSKVESYKDTDHHSASLLGNTARNISPELEENIRPEKQAMDTRKSSRFGT